MNTTKTGSMNCPRAKRRFLIEIVLLAGLSLAVCLPWGCSGQPHTTGPTWNNTFELPNGVMAYPGTFTDASAPAAHVPIVIPADDSCIYITTVEIEVGALGGVVTMQVSDSESAYLTVPPGALLANEKITADVSQEKVGLDLRKTQFQFGPDGLEFRLPALLSIRSMEAEGALLDLEWWDPVGALWVRTAEAVVVTGHATFPVLHFSTYRVTERVSLGGQQKAK